MKQTELIMGMPVTIAVVGGSADVLGKTFDYFRHVDAVFSTYKPASEISRFNRGELSETELSAETLEVLAACERMRHRTNGYFDIRRDNALDPSGLVKGWAIWNAAQLIEAAGYKDYFVDAGGDIQAGGHNDNDEPWSVGLRHPQMREKYVKTLAISDCAIATSGSYERGEHIYDPHTGRAADDPIALTVVGHNIEEADAIATAAFAMGPGRALQFVASQGLEGYMITKDLRATFTEGFERYIKN